MIKNILRIQALSLCALLMVCAQAAAQEAAQAPTESGYAREELIEAPLPTKLMLKTGDRLAICGDSITEQRMYSRLMEDYLTMCVPELKVTVRQYGWSGERANGFLHRMTNDCLRFKPTIATTCYGMNDHEYRRYEDRIGRTYLSNSIAIDEAFKANGVRVIEGSPGCVGKMPTWVRGTNGTVDDLNRSLCHLRNIGIEVSMSEHVGFADVFWPMLSAEQAAKMMYSTNYAISGKDGVHPGWAGHTVMAYAFLKAFGLDGEIGTFTVDLEKQRMKVSKGHELLSAKGGHYQLRSSRYPLCCCVPPGTSQPPKSATYPSCDKDDSTSDGSIRSGMSLVHFNEDLNRLTLVAKHARAKQYEVTWGSESRIFSAQNLTNGINLSAEFPANPFSAAFASVDAAVAAKQAFETGQIKQGFHGSEGKTNIEAVVMRTEKERAPLEQAIKTAFVPVTHTISIMPVAAR